LSDISEALADWFEQLSEVHDYSGQGFNLENNTLEALGRPNITVNATANRLTVEPMLLRIRSQKAQVNFKIFHYSIGL
jgi:hypothetical protein